MSLVTIALALFATQIAAAQDVSIRLENGAFKVVGWQPGASPPDGWSKLFTVRSGADGSPPMLGAYAVEAGALVFKPRFPLEPGLTYRATFHLPEGGFVEAAFEAPKLAPAPSTRVEHVYPSTDLLPENQLKFYVTFTASMGRGQAWRHIHLLDQKGATVDLPFLEIDQELWDRDNRRLTILFDPGRIKRGVTPLEEVGPSIVAGQRYILVIDRDWRDARGEPLEREFRKSFQVGPADRTAVDPARWQVITPKSGTSEALVVRFPKPLDYALLLDAIQVYGASGTLDGNIAVEESETQWRFTPAQVWKAGEYRLVIDTSLEDLAGNRIGKPFDVDTFDRVSERISSKSVSLPFRVREQ